MAMQDPPTIWSEVGAHVHLDRPMRESGRLDGVCTCSEGGE